MRIRIIHELDSPLVLPIAYHHILQSIVYECLKKADGSFGKLHDNGYQYGSREFRLFSFSEIEGPHKIIDRTIVFYDCVSWIVSSCNSEMIEKIRDYIKENGINYNGQYYRNIVCSLDSESINDKKIIINMISPIIAYRTDPGTNKKIYYSPFDKDFYELVNDNFARKYKAFTGSYPLSIPKLEVLNVNKRDKCVTKFKGIYLSGYRCLYLLTGEIKYLRFLYDVGLGSSNSQGFGLFEAIKEE